MARSTGLLALALLALAGATHAAEQPYVYNTVTAVAGRPEFATTVKIFVETKTCAVDNKIFLQDFLSCDFSFVEDLVTKKENISKVACPHKCALQWAKITKACYNDFRARMENSKLLGKLSKKFFHLCDAKAKKDVVPATSFGEDKPATPGGSAGKPATVSATSIDVDGAAPTPAPKETSPTPESNTTKGTLTAYADTTGTNKTAETPGPDMTDMPDAPPGAEAPSIAEALGAAPSPAPAVSPEPEPVVPTLEAAPVPSSATVASGKRVALALVGMVLLML